MVWVAVGGVCAGAGCPCGGVGVCRCVQVCCRCRGGSVCRYGVSGVGSCVGVRASMCVGVDMVRVGVWCVGVSSVDVWVAAWGRAGVLGIDVAIWVAVRVQVLSVDMAWVAIWVFVGVRCGCGGMHR